MAVLALVGLPAVVGARVDRVSPGPRPGLAAPRPDVDPQRPPVRPGGGPGPGPPPRRPAPLGSLELVGAGPEAASGSRPSWRRCSHSWSPGFRSAGSTQRHWPLSALPDLNRQPCSARLFHEQDWGGLIEAECRPMPAVVPRRPLRALRQGVDPRIRRRPRRRPGLGHRPRPRPDRSGLGQARSGAGEEAAQGARMGCPLPGQGLGAVRAEGKSRLRQPSLPSRPFRLSASLDRLDQLIG